MNLNLEKIQKIGSIFSIIVLCLIALSSSLTAYGQGSLPGEIIPPPESPVTSVDQIINILNYVVSIIFTVVIIAAVIIFLWAAFTYITAGGDSSKTKQASNMLMWSAVGLGIALLALGIRAIITNFLQTGAGY
jgi:magnesium-transporting ATPase (P-type)